MAPPTACQYVYSASLVHSALADLKRNFDLVAEASPRWRQQHACVYSMCTSKVIELSSTLFFSSSTSSTSMKFLLFPCGFVQSVGRYTLFLSHTMDLNLRSLCCALTCTYLSNTGHNLNKLCCATTISYHVATQC